MTQPTCDARSEEAQKNATAWNWSWKELQVTWTLPMPQTTLHFSGGSVIPRAVTWKRLQQPGRPPRSTQVPRTYESRWPLSWWLRTDHPIRCAPTGSSVSRVAP